MTGIWQCKTYELKLGINDTVVENVEKSFLSKMKDKITSKSKDKTLTDKARTMMKNVKSSSTTKIPDIVPGHLWTTNRLHVKGNTNKGRKGD